MSSNRIGPFVLEENLRPDGRGSVFRAFHTKQRRSAAVKILTAPLAASSKSAQAEFAEEGERLIALRHPHIVRCYGGALHQNQGYLIHELIEGESLAQILARRGRVSWDQALEIAQRIGEALEYAHGAGVIHGALSPEKIMFADPLGEVKVLDFRIDRNSNPFAQGVGAPSPAFAYQAPEQLAGRDQATAKSDLYSLGCMLFEMITGRLPHQGSTPEELLHAKQTETPPRVSSIELECPVWIDSIVEQLLQADPEKRPFGAGAMNLAFREAAKNLGQGLGAVEHAAGGFSPLAKGMDRDEAQRVLHGNEEEEKPKLQLPRFGVLQLLEKTWFLFVAFAAIIAVLTWSLWPLSEEQLFAEGQRLMEQERLSDWRDAKENYFEPLLERFPDTAHRAEIEAAIVRTDKRAALNRLKLNLRFVRDPQTEGEELFREAWTLENNGEKEEALLAYRKAATEIDAKGEDRAFVLLALDQIKELEKQLAAEDGKKTPKPDEPPPPEED